MKRILFFAVICISLQSMAQSSQQFLQVYGGNANEYAYSVRQTFDRGYAVGGSTSSIGNGVSDGWLVKTDSLGLVQWAKTYGGGNVDIIRCLRQLPDSGYVLAGFSNSYGHGGYDGWLLRTDKLGDTLWTRHFGTSNWDFFYSFTITPTNEIVAVGGTYGLGMGDQDLWIVKTDMNGDTLWTRTLGGAKFDEARGICMLNDSTYAVSGVTKSWGDTLGDSWLIHYETNGDTLWTRTGGQPNHPDEAYGLANNFTNNRIIVAGKTASVNGDWEIRIQTYDVFGTITFTNVLNYQDDDWMESVAVHRHGGYAVVGTTYTNVGGGYGDFYMFRDDQTWYYTTFGTIRQEEGYAVDTTYDKGYIACGFSKGLGNTSAEVLPNMCLIKIDSTGASTTVLTLQEIPDARGSLSTLAYPNPATDEINITVAGDVRFDELEIRVFDLAGRLVLTEKNPTWEMRSPTLAHAQLSTTSLPAGTYLYTIQNESQQSGTGKIMLVR
jgi:hypothetical protein